MNAFLPSPLAFPPTTSLSSPQAPAGFTSVALPKELPSGHASSRASVACTTCRTRKVKCSGTRPSCSSCAKASSPCSYEPVSDEKARMAKERKALKRREKEDALIHHKQRLSLDAASPSGVSFLLDSRRKKSFPEFRSSRTGAGCSSAGQELSGDRLRCHTLPEIAGLGGVPMERSMGMSGVEVPTGWVPPSVPKQHSSMEQIPYRQASYSTSSLSAPFPSVLMSTTALDAGYFPNAHSCTSKEQARLPQPISSKLRPSDSVHWVYTPPSSPPRSGRRDIASRTRAPHPPAQAPEGFTSYFAGTSRDSISYPSSHTSSPSFCTNAGLNALPTHSSLAPSSASYSAYDHSRSGSESTPFNASAPCDFPTILPSSSLATSPAPYGYDAAFSSASSASFSSETPFGYGASHSSWQPPDHLIVPNRLRIVQNNDPAGFENSSYSGDEAIFLSTPAYPTSSSSYSSSHYPQSQPSSRPSTATSSACSSFSPYHPQQEPHYEPPNPSPAYPAAYPTSYSQAMTRSISAPSFNPYFPNSATTISTQTATYSDFTYHYQRPEPQPELDVSPSVDGWAGDEGEYDESVTFQAWGEV